MCLVGIGARPRGVGRNVLEVQARMPCREWIKSVVRPIHSPTRPHAMGQLTEIEKYLMHNLQVLRVAKVRGCAWDWQLIWATSDSPSKHTCASSKQPRHRVCMDGE